MIKKLIFSLALLISLTSCGSEVEVNKEKMPEFEMTTLSGDKVTNDIFSKYDVTIVNFWNTGCGTCIEEMPEIEEMYQEYKNDNINVLAICTDGLESDEKLDFTKEVMKTKGTTFDCLVPEIDSTYYKKFIDNIFSYPTTYVIDSEGNIIGNAIVGNLMNQKEILDKRIDVIKK